MIGYMAHCVRRVRVQQLSIKIFCVRKCSGRNSSIRSPDFNKEVFKGMSSHFSCLERVENKANGLKQAGGLKGVYGEDVAGYKLFKHEKPFIFKGGGVIPELMIAYETWGELNEDKSNAILIHTVLSTSSHAKSSKVIYD